MLLYSVSKTFARCIAKWYLFAKKIQLKLHQFMHIIFSSKLKIKISDILRFKVFFLLVEILTLQKFWSKMKDCWSFWKELHCIIFMEYQKHNYRKMNLLFRLTIHYDWTELNTQFTNPNSTQSVSITYHRKMFEWPLMQH